MGKVLRKFVSRNFITDRWLRDNPDVMIECWGCGNTFHKDDPRKRFCTTNCYLRYWRAIKREPTLITCVWCCKTVEAKRKHAKYCSVRCRQAVSKRAWRRRQGMLELGVTKLKCRECGILFVIMHNFQRYCSYSCRSVSGLRLHREYWRRVRKTNPARYLKKYRSDFLAVTDEDIKRAIDSLGESDAHNNTASEFDQDDWNRRAKEVQARIAARFSTP